MAARKQDTEEQFVKGNHLDDIYAQAKAVDPQLWKTIQGIRDHYCEYSAHCEAIAQQEVLDILGSKGAKGIHSVRFRIKDVNSLLIKVIKKKALLSKEVQGEYEIEKYRALDENNYFKIITDISGIRILIRYREQWRAVHEWIWKAYYKGDEYYLKDFVRDYKVNTGKTFIAERPKVYYRNERDRIFYEQIGKDIFDFKKSDVGYNSIHYIINIDNKYIEIQMRTILDEAWSECTHDIVYKDTNKTQRAELSYLSECLAQQTIAAETITNLIYEKVYKKGTIYGKQKDIVNDTEKPVSMSKVVNNDVEKRMRMLEEQSKATIFDGNIDSIL